MTGPSNQNEPDHALVRRAQQGDKAALRSLLEEIGPAVSQWALARTGDSDDAADLAQEVLILMVRKLPSFRGDSRLLSWLFSVTRNQAIEAHRSRGRRARKMERFSVHRSGEEMTIPAPEVSIDGGRIRNILSAFLTELPQRQREVFQMAELQGLSSPEIGKILDLEPGSVRAALFKARRTLRKNILEQHPELAEEYLS